ncbi:MAG: C40 family peptidase [Acidobacteria bacterium]|nr:C40 family peptidase [Acidobacteriota bacterium]
MKTAIRLLRCISSFAPVGLLLVLVSLSVQAQISLDILKRPANEKSALQLPKLPTKLPETEFINFTSLVFPAFYPALQPPPLLLNDEKSALLYQAITQRLGIPYRFFGTDDRGYDCSGFVWRVFQEAGATFDRVAARTLWQQLPEAAPDEIAQFGTLVFFNGLKHVGIVKDAASFYHSSRSEGVTLSNFAGYWESRITGYRRAPMALIESLPKPPKLISTLTCE